MARLAIEVIIFLNLRKRQAKNASSRKRTVLSLPPDASG